MGSIRHIAVLGAGHIGQLVAKTLHESGDYQVTVIDSNQAALLKVSIYGMRTVCLDIENSDKLTQALEDVEIVANALPHYCATQIAKIAKNSRCHYFDLTEDVASTKAIRDLAKNSDTVFMPQCGLAPGFIGIAAHDLALGFDSLLDLKMRVGALPIYPSNTLKYNLTWSVDGLINEYCQPCEALREGQDVELTPMEGLESFSIDGVEYEAFNTSGGLSTICDTLAGKVQNVDYKTIRYPGHCEIMKVLLNDFRLKNDRETLKRIMVNNTPTTTQDLVVILIVAVGFVGDRLMERVYSTKIFASEDMSAIQITTVAGICAAIDLFCNKQLPQKGFIKQEDIALGAFLSNRFGQVYNNLLSTPETVMPSEKQVDLEMA